MAEKFNPYHKWLGLNEKIKNPHHFQLLGVSPSLTDEEVIRSTVDKNAKRHMQALSKLPPGKYDEIAKKLKKRIVEAHKTLMNPQTRAAYLTKLRAQIAQQQKSKSSQKGAPASKSAKAVPQAQASSADLQPPPTSKNVASASSPAAASPPAQVPPTHPQPVSPPEPAAPQDVLFQATGPEPGSFPEPNANPQHGVQPPAAVVPPAGAPIPMAVPVAASAVPAAPVATEFQEDDGIGEVKIDRKLKRRKKNKWLGPLVALVLLGIAGAGAYSIYQNFDELAKRLGIREDVPPAPGIIEKNDPQAVPKEEPRKELPEVDLNSLEKVDVDAVMNNNATLEQTRRNKEDEGELANLLSGKMPEDENAEVETPTTRPKVVPKEVVAMNAQQLDRFRKAIQRTRRSLLRRDAKVADEQVDEAKRILKLVTPDDETALPDEQAHLATILAASEKLSPALLGFWEHVIEATNGLKGSQVIKLGEVEMAYLESDLEKFILRHNGMNVTYRFENTPPALALAMGNQGYIESIPRWSIQQAAFYAANQTAGTDHKSKIEELLKVAEDANYDCDFIRDYANFDFESMGPSVEKVDLTPEQQESLIAKFRETNTYQKVKDLKEANAQTLAEILLSLNPEANAQRVAFLHEARNVAVHALDVARLEDAICELNRYSNIDSNGMLAKSLLDIAKNRKISKRQTRALMEMAIPFLKSKRAANVDVQVKDLLVKKLTQLANLNEMIDCIWRIEQIAKSAN